MEKWIEIRSPEMKKILYFNSSNGSSKKIDFTNTGNDWNVVFLKNEEVINLYIWRRAGIFLVIMSCMRIQTNLRKFYLITNYLKRKLNEM